MHSRTIIAALASLALCTAAACRASSGPPDGAAGVVPTRDATCPAGTARVMVLGTFPGEEDLFGSPPRHLLAIHTAQRQAELADVVARIAAWRPDKVAIKALRPDSVAPRFARMRAGGTLDEAPLAEQLAARIATELSHPRLFVVGTTALPTVDSLEALLGRREDLAERSEARSLAAQRTAETLLVERMRLPLAEHLRLVNSEPDAGRADRFLTDAYLGVGDGSNYGGPDHIARVFGETVRLAHDVLRLRDARTARVLVIVPARHVAVLLRTLDASSDVCALSAVPLLARDATR